MNYFLACCFGVLISVNGFAAAPTLPPNFIKVTNDNNPQCVEFITYKGEMYCSLVATDNNPVDPQMLTYEKQIVQFDSRPWKAAWAEHNDHISTIEYLPVGDNINHWKELITTQFMPGLADVTVSEFGNRFLSGIKKTGITYKVNTIEEQPNMLIFEFRVAQPKNLQQDEIQKIIKTKDGIYILHYAIKKADMGEENRKKWIGNIKKSTLKN